MSCDTQCLACVDSHEPIGFATRFGSLVEIVVNETNSFQYCIFSIRNFEHDKDHRRNILTADILPIDNGSAILNNRMFEDIPQGAIANLILLRGNIELIEGFVNEHGEEETFRLAAASEATLPFIMVREITLIEE